MSFLNYNYTSNQKSVIDTEEQNIVEDKNNIDVEDKNNIEVEEQSEKQTKEEIKEQDEQSKEQLDSELESFYHIIPFNVRYYSHMAYVQFRELIEYYIPLSNNQDIHEVYPNLFMGNLSTVFNKKLLKDNQITHIVSVISGFKPPYPDDFNYYVIDALDEPTFDMYQYFDDSTFFIESAHKNLRKVYVHCMCGVSRSSTIIVAYLMDKMKKKPDEIITYLQSIRSVVNPNIGFRKQLKMYSTLE
tara:strand:+ start:609 stop:1340 length:732 start_codon:yes stop_codon:yes gene_type:complete